MIDNIYDLSLYKRCSNGLDCVHPENIDGFLLRTCFSKDKNSKDNLRHCCKECSKFHSNLIKKSYPITVRLEKALSKSNKRTDESLILIELSALIVSQEYKCLATKINLIDELESLSLEHLDPVSINGKGEIENLIFMDRQINYAKHNYSLERTFKRIGLIFNKQVSDQDISDRILEFNKDLIIVRENYEIVLPKLQEILAGKGCRYRTHEKNLRYSLELLLSRKISIKDLLDT